MVDRGKGFLISYTVIRYFLDKYNEDDKFRNIIHNILDEDGYEYIDETTYFKLYNFTDITASNECQKEGSRLLNLIKIRAKSNKIKYYETPNKFEVFAILASCYM